MAQCVTTPYRVPHDRDFPIPIKRQYSREHCLGLLATSWMLRLAPDIERS